jgi:hypothetical protein
MLGTSDAHDVWIAIISAIGIVLAATVPTIIGLQLKRGQREIHQKTDDIKDTVGQSNGAGNLTEIGEGLAEKLEGVRAEQDHHAALDEARFRTLHEHLNIPFLEDPDKETS